MADEYDVIVVGAGNAALSAALAAKEICGPVLVVEKAPEYFRGGNTYFTGGIIRFAFDGIEDIKALMPDMSPTEEASVDVGSYTQTQFYDDMMRVTQGLSDPDLAQILVSQSLPTMKWLQEKGVTFVLSYGRQAFKDGDKYRFWGGLLVEAVGAGKGLSDQQFEASGRAGIEVRYSTQGLSLLQDEKGNISGLRVQGPDGLEDIRGRTVVLASGGFEANAEMRCRYLGPGWELVKVRGIPYNTGDGIRMALDVGAQAHGHWSSCHAVAWDMNAPAFGDRTITELYQKHSYPFGIMVNIDGNRFVDEGADFRNYTYVTYGRALLTQPQGLGFQIFDDKVKHLLRDEYNIPQVTMAQADTIEELAARLDINPDGMARTVREYNAAVQQDIPFNPTIKDGRGTVGITPPKTNWAQPIDTPPYLGYAVTCGISFTFGGVKIDTRGQVVTNSQDPIPGLYAAGEMVGGIFYHNYPGGSGLSAGMVFGRLAGTSAAQDAMAMKD
ncbi:MAG: FAD-dependent tricarballylate dehydrogenase TcuA [Chloroflexi bacterium]|nr:FAD-dependent tricarballylate dehydrogenase TcuA [Chloroflexota bacterium]